MLRSRTTNAPLSSHRRLSRRLGIKGSDPRESILWRAESVNEVTVSLRDCRWCEMVEAGASVLVADPAFVIVDPEGIGCAHGNLTLVPRAHVSVLSELGSEEMAAVLAGLSRLLTAIKRASQVTSVEVQAHPEHATEPTHLHFHVVAQGSDAAGAGAPPAEQVLDILQAMSR